MQNYTITKVAKEKVNSITIIEILIQTFKFMHILHSIRRFNH
jgi:hypothetical protein